MNGEQWIESVMARNNSTDLTWLKPQEAANREAGKGDKLAGCFDAHRLDTGLSTLGIRFRRENELLSLCFVCR